MAKNWQPLSVIFNNLGRLDHPLYRTLAHADYPKEYKEYRALAIERALRTGVPIRGQRVTAFGLGPPERIEGKLDAEAAIDIPLDEITFRSVATDFTPASRRPIRRPRIWKPSKKWVKREIELFGSVLAERKLRAERQFSGLSMIAPSAARATRAKKRDHLPPCLEFAKFKRVEADAEALEKTLTPRDASGVELQRENVADASPRASNGPRKSPEAVKNPIPAESTQNKVAALVAFAPAESSFDERAASQVRASFTDDEITDFVKSTGCTNGDLAWPLVKTKFGVKQAHFRSLWKRGLFGGRPGRPVNSVGNSVKI